MMLAKDIMTKGVITLPLDMPVADAQRLLLTYRIHGAPVVGPDGRLVGSVSYVDLLGGSGDRVWDVMAPNPVSASEDTPVEKVAGMMIERMVRRVPIVRDGLVVGIVAASDIIQLFLNLHENPQPARRVPAS
jgi:CBS domain-containing protein